jgi:DNA-directed RNA polymerase specialized sigma24 family protein
MAAVTIQEAARHLGVSQDTIRRRIRKEELQARQMPTPQGFRWVMELEGLEEDAPAAPTPPHRPGIGQVEDGQDLRELVDVLRSQLQSLEEELVARRREVQELHVLLQQKALPEAVGRPWWQFWG